MKVSISQPEHFPYLGFFEKMSHSDLFIILDDVQFSGPRSFQNRNRFLNSQGKMQWFTVPVAAGAYHEMIRDVMVAEDYGWRKKLKRTLECNGLNCDFDKIYQHKKLICINMESIALCREALGISVPMIYSSELNVSGRKAERIYNLCKAVGADTYVSGMGAFSYMEEAKDLFTDVKVCYHQPSVKDYLSTLVHISSPERLTESRKIINGSLFQGGSSDEKKTACFGCTSG